VAASTTGARILVVDDDEGMLLLMAEALRAEHYEVATAHSAKSARTWLEQAMPELMILDLKLPDGSGPALVAELQRDQAPVPFVVVTGQGDEKVAVEVMKQGALDYVMKDSALLDLLPTVVKRALAAVAQEKALAAAQSEQRRLEGEVFAVGERERRSIGADLHDNLGQQLTALELMCTALKEDAAPYPPITKGLDAMSRMLREAVAQTRFLARGLVPVGSDPDALQIGLTELVNRMNAVGRVNCRIECSRPVALPDPQAAAHLYRIAQEAMNNALKHGRPRNIVVRLHQLDDALVLEIANDGASLPKSRPAGTGLGLGVMQHRAAVIGGELQIESKRNEGVTIRCRLPLGR